MRINVLSRAPGGRAMPAAPQGCSWLCPATLVLGCLTASALADVPRRIEIATVPVAEPPFMTKILAPHAACVAVSDVANALAVGFRYEGPAETWIYKLDATGSVVEGEPFKIPLPKPPALKANAVCTATLAFHPAIPLLYVWLDINTPGDIGKPDDNPVFKGFDHLLVVSLASGKPVVAATLCRGPEYAYCRAGGKLLFAADATRLYLPNLRMPTPGVNSMAAAVGYIEIDRAGMPVVAQGKPKLVLEDVSPAMSYSNRNGMVPVSDDIWIFPGVYGPMTLDRTNRRGRITGMACPGQPHTFYIHAHPTLPVIYIVSPGDASAYRVEHVGGFLTNVEQRADIRGIGLHTPPVVMAKRKLIACGSNGRVVLMGIDDAGGFTKEAMQVPVKAHVAGGLAWSEKFDRLYVAAEAK